MTAASSIVGADTRSAEFSAVQVESDRKIGKFLRRRWAAILVAGERVSISGDQIRAFVKNGGLTANDDDRRLIATQLGFDWEGAAEFFAAVAPIIMEMMEACAAI